MKILVKYPDYSLFTNNCQNFGKYLIKTICLSGDEICPPTIQDMLEPPHTQRHKEVGLQLPGAYPQSETASVRGTSGRASVQIPLPSEGLSDSVSSTATWVTARTSLESASGRSWATATVVSERTLRIAELPSIYDISIAEFQIYTPSRDKYQSSEQSKSISAKSKRRSVVLNSQ